MNTCGECSHWDDKAAGIPAGVGVCYGAPPTVVVIPMPVPVAPQKGKILNPNAPGSQQVTFPIEIKRPMLMGTERACGLFSAESP
jgi:hypothetical protein